MMVPGASIILISMSDVGVLQDDKIDVDKKLALELREFAVLNVPL